MLKEIRTLLRPIDILILLMLSLLALLTNLGLLGAAAWLISSAALQPPLYTLALGITAVRALGIGRALLRYGERYFTHKSAFSILSTLRLRLYDNAAVLAGFPQATKTKSTLLNEMLARADILQDFLLRGLLPPLSVLLAILLAALLLSPILSYMVIILPVLYFIHCLPLWIKYQPDTGKRYQSQLLDFAQGSHELLLAGSLARASAKLAGTAKDWQKSNLRDLKHADQLNLLLGLLRIAVFLLFFIFLLAALQQNSIDGISLAVWLLILWALFNELALVPTAARYFRQAHHTSDWLHIPAVSVSTCAKPAPCTDKLLTVSGLGFHYPQGMPVFSSLNFSLVSGGHTAIIGDSGCGKTTLAYLLAGLWQPTAGIIRYGIATQPFVCTIPQGSFLFSASIRENFLRLHPTIAEQEILTVLQTAQLANTVTRLPQGLDTPLGENACCLSGGERNRLISALILASCVPVLLFDEPTAGLDRQTADKLVAAIIAHANAKGQTVILITHDTPQLSLFSQVIRLRPAH